MMSMGHRLDAVIASKGWFQILSVIYFHLLKYSLFSAHLKIGWSDNRGAMF